ncbi:MAG: glycosyltransferase family 2 protein [Gammaproteobacteria bacterium]|nr:glycosyltransferase family 2 protein [Gammaproteobacteria bacterium]MCP5136953.1 glycosyltransferase family 2 protein [Gammaproteobacteria bacterium]
MPSTPNPPSILAIVVPCYNEEAMLGITVPGLLNALDGMIESGLCAMQSYIVLVDDGSRDATWHLIEDAATRYPGRVRGVRLASNVGHQAALLSGLDYATGRCDAAVSIDADLQDDVTVIARMIEAYHCGAQMVLGVRECRATDSWFKRNTAEGFYRLMGAMGVEMTHNHADFRLMSDRVLRNLREFSEINLFLRGLPRLLHKEVVTVSYRRAERVAGETKYPLRKMLALAWNGITSFSVVPLRMISVMGALVFLVSLVLSAYALFGFLSGSTLPGWASVVIPLYLLGGLLMLSIGVVGEYVGKVFLETKRRPRFLVDQIVGDPDD